MNKLKIDYLDDIMSKANYALMKEEINCKEWFKIILTISIIIENKYNEQKGIKNELD